ncbi:hypothetical protein L596_013776 [Steinernema carpocapsae]|uniref:Uncharacterized protein n=1 Tax=Steinernema carpocapsae TaxID=34508 RepID=A0A4V6A586_STECR|nr:hypothetical protein L596_013776 [Steinernema carpocapsae]
MPSIRPWEFVRNSLMEAALATLTTSTRCNPAQKCAVTRATINPDPNNPNNLIIPCFCVVCCTYLVVANYGAVVTVTFLISFTAFARLSNCVFSRSIVELVGVARPDLPLIVERTAASLSSIPAAEAT